MKHLHILMALITLSLYLYQASFVVRGIKPVLSKAFKGLSHAIYTVLVLTGLYLFWQIYQAAGVQMWAVVKVALLVVAVSANIKAIRPSATFVQTKAGFVIAALAYVGILVLALLKPM